MLLVARRVGIIAWRNRIGIAPTAVTSLDTNFTAAEVSNGPLGSLLGLSLRAMHAASSLCIGCFHGPAFAVLGYISIRH
jgi:hypothetical protein